MAAISKTPCFSSSFSKEICTDDDNVYLCPLCKHYAFCDFRKLRDLCLKKQLSYVLDNSVSVFLAVCTSIWGEIVADTPVSNNACVVFSECFRSDVEKRTAQTGADVGFGSCDHH